MIRIGDKTLNDIKLDFGLIDPKGEVNGLLGLNILIKLAVIIDLKNFEMWFKE